MTKLKKRSGFTLAELLIVVAIIAILVAIGVPAFSTAMERSRETVDLSNIRGAYAEFMADSLGSSIKSKGYPVEFKQRDNSGWVTDVSGFTSNIANTSMPNVPKAGAGYVVFTYANDTDEKPTLSLSETDTSSGGSGSGSGSGGNFVDPND